MSSSQIDALIAIDAKSEQVGGDHYSSGISPRDYILANKLGFDEANVVKYVSRHERKNGIEDIKKAIHYCLLLIDDQYPEVKVEVNFNDADIKE